jgi:hypothetical protein
MPLRFAGRSVGNGIEKHIVQGADPLLLAKSDGKPNGHYGWHRFLALGFYPRPLGTQPIPASCCRGWLHYIVRFGGP